MWFCLAWAGDPYGEEEPATRGRVRGFSASGFRGKGWRQVCGWGVISKHHFYCPFKQKTPPHVRDGVCLGRNFGKFAYGRSGLLGCFDFLNCLGDPCGDLVRVALGVWTAVFQVALPVCIGIGVGNPDGCTAVGDAVAEFVYGLGFVGTGETQFILRTVGCDVCSSRYSSNLAMRALKKPSPPVSRMYLEEKLECIPEPFQSPAKGLQCQSTSTPYFSQTRKRM